MISTHPVVTVRVSQELAAAVNRIATNRGFPRTSDALRAMLQVGAAYFDNYDKWNDPAQRDAAARAITASDITKLVDQKWDDIPADTWRSISRYIDTKYGTRHDSKAELQKRIATLEAAQK